MPSLRSLPFDKNSALNLRYDILPFTKGNLGQVYKEIKGAQT